MTISTIAESDVAKNTADQLNLAVLITCMQVSCAEYSCVLFGARNLYKKILSQESVTYAQT